MDVNTVHDIFHEHSHVTVKRKGWRRRRHFDGCGERVAV
jgi:hypothetical protein